MEFFAGQLSRAESDATIDRIQARSAQHGFGFFAAELRATGEFIGFIGLSRVPFEAHFTPCVEIDWTIAAAHWNQGLATEGARACLRHAFEDLGLAEVVAFTVPANQRSRRVMENSAWRMTPPMISTIRSCPRATRCARTCCTAPDCYNRTYDEVQHFSPRGLRVRPEAADYAGDSQRGRTRRRARRRGVRRATHLDAGRQNLRLPPGAQPDAVRPRH
jgi:hypothetical protein